MITTAILTQAAIISVMDKKGAKAFKELIEQLGGGKTNPADELVAPKKGRTTHAQRQAVPVPKGKRDSRIPKAVRHEPK